jgi:HlyD family secretion protein
MIAALPRAWLVLGTCCVLIAGCGAPPSSPSATVARGDLSQTVHAAGTVLTATQTKLGFKAGGRIASIDVAVGDTVPKGQVLAELDTTDATVAVHQAQAASQVARAGVAMAQAKLDQVLAGARPETIAQANALANIAREKLRDLLAGGRPEQVAQAQADLDAAQQKLDLALGGARQEQVQQARAGLQQAQAKLQALQNGPRPEQVAVLQEQVEAAKNALYTAQAVRDGDCRSNGATCTVGQAQVTTAQAALDTAQRQLVLATAPPTATDLQQAQAAVDQAQAQVNMLLANTPQDVQTARDGVARAEQALALARNPSTGPQIQQAREAVNQADAAAQLAAHPYTDADVEAAQAAVQQAQAQSSLADAALEAAQVGLENLRITAPAAGKVLQVNNSAGEVVTAGTSAIVFGIGGLIVNAGLPQASFARVKPGQSADVTFDSIPGKTYSGSVTELPQAGTPTQNLVSYVVGVKLDQLDDSVKVGANGSVTIYTVQKKNVLLVPNAAVQTLQGKQAVMTLGDNGQARPAEVQLGLADDDNVEVLAGLAEGQRVQIARPADATSLGGKP